MTAVLCSASAAAWLHANALAVYAAAFAIFAASLAVACRTGSFEAKTIAIVVAIEAFGPIPACVWLGSKLQAGFHPDLSTCLRILTS